MIIKEYRIPLPMTVEEYRIAQLYMIQVSPETAPDSVGWSQPSLLGIAREHQLLSVPLRCCTSAVHLASNQMPGTQTHWALLPCHCCSPHSHNTSTHRLVVELLFQVSARAAVTRVLPFGLNIRDLSLAVLGAASQIKIWQSGFLRGTVFLSFTCLHVGVGVYR